jgi:hypothetical protein
MLTNCGCMSDHHRRDFHLNNQICSVRQSVQYGSTFACDSKRAAREPAARVARGWLLSISLVAIATQRVWPQHVAFSGQVSGLLNSKPDSTLLSQAGLRYIPELVAQEAVGGDDSLALDVSLDGLLLETLHHTGPASLAASLAAYRAWLRFATHHFETRIGLQKITFGSATLFRPLMWFDRVDPRDPLQITDGVTGALARYYFPNNANLWAWGLYGNTSTTGWETTPTEHGTVEYGGRVQLPVPAGELGATYHHRDAYTGIDTGGAATPEDRFGLDGKWNLGVGVWGEAVLVHQRTDLFPTAYQRFSDVGADYTIPVGGGLHLLTETARFETPVAPFAGGRGVWFSGLLGDYPVGLLDRLSAIVYADWSTHQWYRILMWQRAYDMWTFDLLGFWNPNQPQGLAATPLSLGPAQQSQAFAGRGIEVVAAFNY